MESWAKKKGLVSVPHLVSSHSIAHNTADGDDDPAGGHFRGRSDSGVVCPQPEAETEPQDLLTFLTLLNNRYTCKITDVQKQIHELNDMY